MAEEQQTAPVEGTPATTTAEPTTTTAATTPDVATTPEVKTEVAAKPDYSHIPAKFLKADGTPDDVAMSKSYLALEKKIGKQGSFAPESVDEYVHEATKVQFDEEQHKAFKEEALKAGLSTEQYQWMLSKYEDDVQRFLPSAEKTTEVLSAAWGDDFESNVKYANQAASVYVPSNVSREDILANPLALQILSRIGSEMREDTAPPVKSSGPSKITEDDIKAMMGDPDYYKNNERSKELNAKVDEYYRKNQ